MLRRTSTGGGRERSIERPAEHRAYRLAAELRWPPAQKRQATAKPAAAGHEGVVSFWDVDYGNNPPLRSCPASAPRLTRADLEAAANAFFLRLLEQEDGERDPDDRIIAEDLAEYERRVGELERQFRQNRYDRRVERDAERIVRQAGGNLADLDETSRRYALQLSARVSMEWVRFLVHVHRTPSIARAGSLSPFWDLHPGTRPTRGWHGAITCKIP